ncbi:hypothetical protein SAMN04488101_105212 [Pedobacter nyackensis]|uniref:Uncharacterized protein n=1 Tax=Pedobacter nyackensis TaxID=475255 RepID=A0A1W2D2S3_9SPHI|nr:hypothetical protein SAMN04488101_105212 [Pedobacter nyackensis]
MLIGCCYTKYDFGIRYRLYACIVILSNFFLKLSERLKNLIKIMFLLVITFMFKMLNFSLVYIFFLKVMKLS